MLALLLSFVALQGGVAESVTVKSRQATIAAEFVSAGPDSPGVLLFPMCAPEFMGGWRPLAERLRARGISSLAVRYQSWGGSTGTPPPARTTLQDAQRFWTAVWGPDAEAAFAYLRSRVGPTAPIAVAGSSCGVHMALLTAMHHRDAVKAVVAVAGPHSAAQESLLARQTAWPSSRCRAKRIPRSPA